MRPAFVKLGLLFCTFAMVMPSVQLPQPAMHLQLMLRRESVTHNSGRPPTHRLDVLLPQSNSFISRTLRRYNPMWSVTHLLSQPLNSVDFDLRWQCRC